MFPLVNGAPPLVADTVLLRDRDGAETIVVCVKGTFDIDESGSPILSSEQQPLTVLPTHRGAPGQSSLIAEPDIGLPTPSTDVTCAAVAYAPHGTAVRCLDVSISVGRISKTLRVAGDRYWRSGARGHSISEAIPFERVPILYERAYGGRATKIDGSLDWDERNPIGTGWCCEPPRDGQLLPNIEYPDKLVRSWKDRPPPAGFGPIERHWMPRRTLAGTYDEEYLKHRSPLPPVDLDDRFYLSSSADQQAGRRLVGGEEVTLVNLTTAGFMRFAVPKLRLGLSCHIAGSVGYHAMHLDALRIQTDSLRLEMLWRASIPCHRKSHKVRRINVWAKEWLFEHDRRVRQAATV